MVLIDLDSDRPVALRDVSGANPLRTLGLGAVSACFACDISDLSCAVHAYWPPADGAYEARYIDTLAEVRAAYEFLAAINSAQVWTYDVPAPAKLNDKRRRNGKVPFSPYKVLDLCCNRWRHPNGGAAGYGLARRAALFSGLRRLVQARGDEGAEVAANLRVVQMLSQVFSTDIGVVLERSRNHLRGRA